MFKPIDGDTRCIEIRVDGEPVQAREGDLLALALLRADKVPMRHSPASGSPRAPLCLMGVCFECLVRVDGQANVQSCMVVVRDGMDVRLQHGAPDAEVPR